MTDNAEGQRVETSARIVNQDYAVVPLVELGLHPRNPRRGDVEAIGESIDANGFYGAVVVNRRDSKVLAGNHRLKAAQQMGMTSVPVIWVDVDDSAALRILLADNRTNDVAGYDTDDLVSLLTQLQAQDQGLLGTGYDDAALDALLADLDSDPKGMMNPDDLPDHMDRVVPEIAQLGDVWQCGAHRIICGDSTDPATFATLLDAERADLVFTSPPYNTGIAYGGYDDKAAPWEEYCEFLERVVVAVKASMGKGRAMCWNIPASASSFFARQFEMITKHLGYRRTMIWHKVGVPMPGWRMAEDNPLARNFRANPVFEFVFVFENGLLEHGGPVQLDDTIASDVFYVAATQSTADLPSGDGNTGGRSAATLSRRRRPKAHPATFPVQLPQPFVNNLCGPGEIVLDPFAGAGSTLLAAQRTGRRGYGAELTPRYVDLSLWRLQRETGLLPTKDGVEFDFMNSDA